MDSSVSPKDEIWFLRVCHHISNAVYQHSCEQRNTGEYAEVGDEELERDVERILVHQQGLSLSPLYKYSRFRRLKKLDAGLVSAEAPGLIAGYL
jgi:hypothetical protein